jgi:hypothetical protein
MQSRSSYAIASDAPLAYLLIQLHHTGSQEEVPVVVQEDQAGVDPTRNPGTGGARGRGARR